MLRIISSKLAALPQPIPWDESATKKKRDEMMRGVFGPSKPQSPVSAPPSASVQSLDYYELDSFTQQYITTALWSSLDNDGNPLDQNYDSSDIDAATLAKMHEDCQRFQQMYATALKEAYQTGQTRSGGYDEESAGHDFWLSRNGHGAGFWDRDLGPIGDRLTEAAQKFGEYHLDAGEDDTGQTKIFGF